MKLDCPLPDIPPQRLVEHSQWLEQLGVDGVWSFETTHDPLLPLLPIALATDTINIGTNIAVAFARSPFSLAMTAWDLQRASNGRLLLGLGTQVRAHIERRFSMPFTHPAARISDYIHCLRAIWNTFQTHARADYEGRFYRFTLINDFFNPGPIAKPHIPILLAGVNPRMADVAGEAADGFCLHPLHSANYLREVIWPALRSGGQRSGRSQERFEVVANCFVVHGASAAERLVNEAAVRQQIAFYASTPSYRGFLEFHGAPALGKRLNALMRSGQTEHIGSLIDDRLLAAVAVSAADGDLARLIAARYRGGLATRILFYAGLTDTTDAGSIATSQQILAAV